MSAESGNVDFEVRLEPAEALRRVQLLGDDELVVDVAGGRFTFSARGEAALVVVEGTVGPRSGGARVAASVRDDVWSLGHRQSGRAALERLARAFADVPRLPAVAGAAPAEPPPPSLLAISEYLPSESQTLYATATVPGAAHLRLDIRRGHVYPVERALGVQDDLLGDAAFDERFIVRANDLPFARAWLSPHIRSEMLALADHVGVALDDGALALTVQGAGADAAGRQRIFALARLIAGRARELLDEWRAVAGALGGRLRTSGDGWAPDGASAIDLECDGVTVSIDATPARTSDAEPQLFTRLYCDRLALDGVELLLCAPDDDLLRSSYEPLEVVPLGDAALDGAYRVRASHRGRRLVTASLAQKVAACRPDRVRVAAEEVRVYLRGFERDVGRLGAACELAAALAAQGAAVAPAGPYR